MAGLQAADFRRKKQSSGGPYKGQNYFEIVANKIKDYSQFTIGSKEGPNKVYGLTLLDKEGKLILSYTNIKNSAKPTGEKVISQFFKDPDFGGGKGSGGGAADTAITESMQCFYLSLLYNSNKSKLDNKNSTLKDLQTQEKFCFTYERNKRLTAKECFDRCPDDWFKKDGFINTAN